MMDIYAIALFLFSCLLVGAAYWQPPGRLSLINRSGSEQLDVIDDELHNIESDSTAIRFYKFRTRYMQIHGLAIAADWLQSPFVYSLYRNKGAPDSIIAALFATGFLFGGLSAPVISPLADTYGRKRACLLFCILYSISSLTALSDSIWLLALGRALAGVSITLLSTVFEMWMLGEYQRHGFGHTEEALRAISGAMSNVKGFIAVATGITSQFLVRCFELDAAPFIASIVCLASLFVLISNSWVENYSSTGSGSRGTLSPSVPTDSRSVLALGSAICAIEVSVCMITAFWPPSLISARDMAFAWAKGKVSFGFVFANFMCASAVGSLGFTYLSSTGNSIRMSSQFAQVAMVACSICLLTVVAIQGETLRFWGFCIFHAFVGVYGPSIAYLKGRVMEDHQRAKVYGVMQVPLNLFVAGALLTVEDDNVSRNDRFMLCSGLLLFATILMAVYVPQSSRSR